MATLGMNRLECLWDTPSCTITRCMAAHMERNGRKVRWHGDELIDRILDEYERRKHTEPDHGR